MKKEVKDPFMKLRIIVSTLALIIILGGWVIYGISISYSNPTKVLVKLSKQEKERIPRIIEKSNLKDYLNSKITINKDNTIYLHNSNKKLYLIKDNKYYDITKKLNISISNKSFNPDKYSVITESLLNSIVYNRKLLNLDLKKDKAKKIYIYSYSLSSLEPAILTLKSDVDFINSMEYLFDIDREQLYNILDKYKHNTLSINIHTKGYSREIYNYNLQIEDLLNINIGDKYINGFILGNSFNYEDNKLTIYTENNDYIVKIDKYKNKISNKEETNLKEILDFYK